MKKSFTQKEAIEYAVGLKLSRPVYIVKSKGKYFACGTPDLADGEELVITVEPQKSVDEKK